MRRWLPGFLLLYAQANVVLTDPTWGVITTHATRTYFTAPADPSCSKIATLRDQLVAGVWKTLQGSWKALGTCDAEMILPVLHHLYPDDDPSTAPILIDVGAHIGRTAERMVSLFTLLECYRSLKNLGIDVNEDPTCVDNGARVYSFEPSHVTFAALAKRAAEELWSITGWSGFRMAASDHASHGTTMTLYGMGTVMDTQASLSPHHARGDESTAATVPVVSIDALFDPKYGRCRRKAESDSPGTVDDTPANNLNPSGREIFLLKTDTEGYDPMVLMGAQGLLERKLVKFIVSEYNDKWFYPNAPHSLGSLANEYMLPRGYWCFLMTPSDLVPLFGPWWHPSLGLCDELAVPARPWRSRKHLNASETIEATCGLSPRNLTGADSGTHKVKTHLEGVPYTGWTDKQPPPIAVGLRCWSNFFCGRKDDPDLIRVLRFYNKHHDVVSLLTTGLSDTCPSLLDD